MRKEKIYAVVSKVKSLPTLPDILVKVAQLLEDPETSASDVNKVISKDMALATRVLKLANSAFYGFPSEISSITHAVAVLGFDTLKTLLLTASVFDLFSMQQMSERGFDRNKLWEHSLGVAVACTAIGKYTKAKNVAELFTGGLLHDIGKIIFDHYLSDEFEEIIKIVQQKDVLILEAEEQHLGINHADIGAYLIEVWNLPRSLQNMIKYHHFSSFYGKTELSNKDAAIVHLADILVRAKQIGSGGDNQVPELSPVAWELLDLKMGDLEILLQQIDDECKKAAQFLKN